MTKIGILGANGRMGRVLIEAIYQHQSLELSLASVRDGSSFVGIDVGQLAGIANQNLALTSISECEFGQTDVLIDFTLATALDANLEKACEQAIPIVIGTTGLSESQLSRLDEAAKHIPIVFAANYSVGVNLMLNLVKQAALVMGEQSDIEILEAHHRFKQDSPSGTAMAIGKSIADTLNRDLAQCAVYGREGFSETRDRQTIGFATVRAGDIVGEHTALFASLGERLEITHKASSRMTFANGALEAANWLVGKPKGLYSMQDVLGLA
ncbi:4-hydroxy-tetrahydrodipicolinate reductase [Ningiella sp. W23]|uniref:4-hydroxy-tetrahydrodipicolinate reductase n=1 Tax=Ningiella sp. W23 TaxID=3023715 RepID=UPI003758264D